METGDWVASGLATAALVVVFASIIVGHYRKRAERRRQGLPADDPSEGSIWEIFLPLLWMLSELIARWDRRRGGTASLEHDIGGEFRFGFDKSGRLRGFEVRFAAEKRPPDLLEQAAHARLLACGGWALAAVGRRDLVAGLQVRRLMLGPAERIAGLGIH